MAKISKKIIPKITTKAYLENLFFYTEELYEKVQLKLPKYEKDIGKFQIRKILVKKFIQKTVPKIDWNMLFLYTKKWYEKLQL